METTGSPLILVSPTTPYLVRTGDNSDGAPSDLMDAMFDSIAFDFPKWVGQSEAPFFTPETHPETRAWIKAMMLSIPAPVAVAFRGAAGRTDFRPDLGAIDLPTLVQHGDNDASAFVDHRGQHSASMIAGAKLIGYEGAPHVLPQTHRET